MARAERIDVIGRIVQAHLDIVDDRHLLEQTDVLKGARNPAAINFQRRFTGQRLAVKEETTGCRTIDAGKQVENGGFPCPIGAD